MTSKHIHFQGFNTLRFYAALSVIVQHISYSPYDWFGQPLLPSTAERFFLTGTDAVNLFFVLSGFLITYLLLVEHERYGRVSIRNFYIRRSLRIYPVYYVFLLGVYLILRPPYELELTLMLFFFLGNVAFVQYFPFPPLEHLWSLAVEEQYYFSAPVLARFPKSLHKILLGIIGFWLTLLIVMQQANPQIALFLNLTRYDLIAFGALLGYLYYHDHPFLNWLRLPIIQVTAYTLIAGAIIFAKPTDNVLYTTSVAFAFGVMIYNLVINPPARLIFPRLEQLGNYSYSMYVYHPFFVLLFNAILHERLPYYGVLIYPITIGCTLLTSRVSYKYLEQPFLNLKSRFKQVPSQQVGLETREAQSQ